MTAACVSTRILTSPHHQPTHHTNRHQRRSSSPHQAMPSSALRSFTKTTQQRSVQRCPHHTQGSRACNAQPTLTTSARVHRAQDREMPCFYSSSTLHERTGVLGRDFSPKLLSGLEKSPVSDTRASTVASVRLRMRGREPIFLFTFAHGRFITHRPDFLWVVSGWSQGCSTHKEAWAGGIFVRKGRGIILRFLFCIAPCRQTNADRSV